jgi:hypothetical protein
MILGTINKSHGVADSFYGESVYTVIMYPEDEIGASFLDAAPGALLP